MHTLLFEFEKVTKLKFSTFCALLQQGKGKKFHPFLFQTLFLLEILLTTITLLRFLKKPSTD